MIKLSEYQPTPSEVNDYSSIEISLTHEQNDWSGGLSYDANGHQSMFIQEVEGFLKVSELINDFKQVSDYIQNVNLAHANEIDESKIADAKSIAEITYEANEENLDILKLNKPSGAVDFRSVTIIPIESSAISARDNKSALTIINNTSKSNIITNMKILNRMKLTELCDEISLDSTSKIRGEWYFVDCNLYLTEKDMRDVMKKIEESGVKATQTELTKALGLIKIADNGIVEKDFYTLIQSLTQFEFSTSYDLNFIDLIQINVNEIGGGSNGTKS